MAGEVLYPETFDAMAPGVVRLSTPTLRDVILVQAAGGDGTTALSVEKTEWDARIFREDGMPLSVFVKYSAFDETFRARKLAAYVFETPVDAVDLSRHAEMPEAWVMGENMPPCNIDAAEVFLSAIGHFARIKQEP